MFLRVLFFLFLAFLAQCTSLSKRKFASDPELSPDLAQYQRARQLESLDKKLACSVYTQLVSNPSFVLYELSLIRARLICSDTNSLPEISHDLMERKPWLSSLYAEHEIHRAKKSKDNVALANAYILKAQLQKTQSEKTQLLKMAMTLASPPMSEKNSNDIREKVSFLAPSLIEDQAINKKNGLRRAMDFINRRQFSRARQNLNQIIQSAKTDLDKGYKARMLLARSFKLQLNKIKYVQTLKNLTLWLESQNDRTRLHDTYTLLARAQWTEGLTSQAQSTLERAEKKLAGIYPLDEIELIHGRMDEEIGDFEGAKKHYQMALAELKDNSPMEKRERLLFLEAWCYRKLGQHEEAAKKLSYLASQTKDESLQSRYMFWQARSESESTSNRTLKKLIEIDPLGYYGLLAHQQLEIEIPSLNEKKSSSPPDFSKYVPEEIVVTANALLVVQEKNVLENYLNHQVSHLKEKKDNDRNIWLFYLLTYAEADLFLPLFSQLGSLPLELKKELLVQYPELLFPRKYEGLLTEWGEKFSVSPELMFSIIRQESAFNPLARSPADAFGLMQVLPTVAKANQKKTGIKLSHFEQLLKPEYNVPYGAALLDTLKNRYDNKFILMTAAYNASESAIEGWIRTRFKGDVLEFIEDIPYEETRAYVKLVMRNYIFYTRLRDPQKSVSSEIWSHLLKI